MNQYITIGEIIKYYRTEKGLSQNALAQGICDRKYISHIENSKHIPTLDIINQLSTRLGINLYDSYALMLRNHDLDTYKKIENLQSYLVGPTSKNIMDLVNEYKNLPSFQYGEPLQCLKYATALYYGNCLQEHQKAILYAIEALSENESFSIDISNPKRSFSNLELSLLNLIAVSYCRLEQKDEAKKYFELAHNYLVTLFAQNHYATNRNQQFEIKFWATHICNYFLFFRDTHDFSIDILDNVLITLKKYSCNHRLPELLLCKTYLLQQHGKSEDAKKLYLLAHTLGNYLYDPVYHKEHNEKHLLGEYYTYFSS